MRSTDQLPNLPEKYKLESDIYAQGKTESGCDYGVCSIRGVDLKNHKEQEDKTDISGDEFVAKLTAMPITQQVKAMQSAFERSHRAVNAADEGSCATVVAANIKDGKLNAVVGYVGDSPAYRVTIKKNKTITAAALNPDFHDQYNANEVNSITKDDEKSQLSRAAGQREKGKLIRGRLVSAYGLAVTRAIGDNAYDKEGISHVGQFALTVNQKVDKGDRVFILTGCDGIMEHCKGEGAAHAFKDDIVSTLTTLMQSNAKPTCKQMSEAIVDNALAKGSKDNISVVVTEVKGPVLAAVYDGHGGQQVSEYLGKHHFDNIKSAVNQLEKQKDKGLMQSAVAVHAQSVKRFVPAQPTASSTKSKATLFSSRTKDSRSDDDARFDILMDLKMLLEHKSFPTNETLEMLQQDLSALKDKSDVRSCVDTLDIMMQHESSSTPNDTESRDKSSDSEDDTPKFFESEDDDAELDSPRPQRITEAVAELIHSLNSEKFNRKTAMNHLDNLKSMLPAAPQLK